ncbi:hypothetical protein QE152_g5140 [Popillia japonica]|uniref:Proline-rich transmembrane protein 3/4 domain-containing protein n=1 Tax=Popillia japonica TaxID=7064 RepID=A0AAW1MQJ8_POPJA
MSDQIELGWNIRDHERSQLIIVNSIDGKNDDDITCGGVEKMSNNRFRLSSNSDDGYPIFAELISRTPNQDDGASVKARRTGDLLQQGKAEKEEDAAENASEYDFSCDLFLNNNNNDNTQLCGTYYYAADDIKCCDGRCTISDYYHKIYHAVTYYNLILSILYVIAISLYLYLFNMCLYFKDLIKERSYRRSKCRNLRLILVLSLFVTRTEAFANEFDKTEHFLDKINLEQSIAAVFNKVAYGSTTKRSIPDNAYPVTTLATPLLTTYRYSDGSDEFYRVDVKKPGAGRPNFDYDPPEEPNRNEYDNNYGSNLEKDHVLPTTAPAADILKNNNNKNYDNPNRYNNDRLKPNFELKLEPVTESIYRTTTGYNGLRNVRPTKSIYSKDVPNYVPPSRAFFTPPLPPEYVNPFADKPTLRGTNSDGFANRRPIPPPSLMPNNEKRIPDLPPNKVINMEKTIDRPTNHNRNSNNNNNNNNTELEVKNEKKKTLNTPSQNINLDRSFGELYGRVRINESNFEYDKGYIPSITRILSGSNGRHDDISDILLRSVTATPNIQRSDAKIKTRPSTQESTQKKVIEEKQPERKIEDNEQFKPMEKEPALKKEVEYKTQERTESVTIKKEVLDRINNNNNQNEMTTQSSEFVNLPNVKEKENNNVTKASSDEIWVICWNVHVYLVVLLFVILALFSIYKLIRYENDPHMFSKSYFLTIHLMLTVICVLRIFYLMYDPYNVDKSFNIFL